MKWRFSDHFFKQFFKFWKRKLFVKQLWGYWKAHNFIRDQNHWSIKCNQLILRFYIYIYIYLIYIHLIYIFSYALNFSKNIVCYIKHAEHMNNHQAFANFLREDIKVKLSTKDIFTIFLYQGAIFKFSDNFYCKWLYVMIMSRTSFWVNSHSIVCLNVKELLAQSRCHI